MNRLWVRISLTFVGVVFFVIAIPITIVLTSAVFAGAFDNQPAGLVSSDGEAARPRPLFEDASESHPVFDFLHFFAFVALLGAAVGVLSTRGLTAPLNKLVEAAKAVGAKNLSRRVDVKGTDEIKAVAQAFNEMAAELEKAETLRTNLLNDVAHELRTPITVIQGSLRAILDDVYEMDKAEIARLYDQTRHLSRLVDDLRELAQAEANQLPLNLTSVNVEDWVQGTAAAFRPISAEKNVTVLVEVLSQPPQIMADQARLTQCLHNLLNNALQHTPAGGTIAIRVDPAPDALFLRVQDTGEGIEAQHLPYIFDRFYRPDLARSRQAGGTGLGLAITRSYVEAHGGTIEVASEGPGKGTTFTIQLRGVPNLCCDYSDT
ncbi:MAG TPA: ATP-binding protein [Anaerolineales bacterium]|nr:ATP-binding protein [Anaerolineales bacterium]